MRTRKTKYARVGEFIRIASPMQFIRCGYPLSIKGIMSTRFVEIEKHVARMFAALENKPIPSGIPEPDTFSADSLDSWLLAMPAPTESNMSATVHGMLAASVAAWMLENESFGGNERLIFEQENEWLAVRPDSPWLVTGKRIVKTGTRFSGKSYRSHEGEYNYEPGGLEDEKTHCVYEVRRDGTKFSVLAGRCERIN